jgi:hypothetical protein
MLKILLARGEVASKANDDWQRGRKKKLLVGASCKREEKAGRRSETLVSRCAKLSCQVAT